METASRPSDGGGRRRRRFPVPSVTSHFRPTVLLVSFKPLLAHSYREREREEEERGEREAGPESQNASRILPVKCFLQESRGILSEVGWIKNWDG